MLWKCWNTSRKRDGKGDKMTMLDLARFYKNHAHEYGGQVFLSIKGAAKLLKMDTREARRFIDENKVPHYILDSKRVYCIPEVLKYIEET